MLYVPGFTAPAWAEGRRHLPDLPGPLPQRPQRTTTRRPATSATTTRSCSLPWGASPRATAATTPTANVNCPWRFDPHPPSSPTRSSRAAVTTWAATSRASTSSSTTSRRSASTRSTSTRSSTPAPTTATTPRTTARSIPYFGTQKDWDNLVKHADQAGIRIILDGVFNHMSSDSPFFDRYHHYATVGACESATLAVSQSGSPSTRSPGPTATCVGAGRPTRDLRRLVRLRLDPGPAQDRRRRSRRTS